MHYTKENTNLEDDYFNKELAAEMESNNQSSEEKKTVARKPKKVTAEEAKDDVWNCRFYLPKKLHMSVKLLSSFEGISIQQLMENALKMYIKSKKKEIDKFLSEKFLAEDD